jgi:predicted nucleic acid binding AN1-type Zn finger protein
MKCDICGSSQPLPYKCRHCGGSFCSYHRLPEKHNCNVDWTKPDGIRDKIVIEQREKAVVKHDLHTDMPKRHRH